MKCFCHGSVEAVAACRNCGKGMCSSCSAYSGHSGICPACRKVEFENEVRSKLSEIKDCTTSIVWAVILGILLCWTVIAIFVAAIYIAVKASKKAKLQERVNALMAEIDKIDRVYLQHMGKEFI